MAKTADVVIIGAGVMGASIAFNLARRGVTNVAVLEKNFIAAGATGKSSACVRQHYSTEVGARMVMRSLEIFQNFSEIVGGTGWIRENRLPDGCRRARPSGAQEGNRDAAGGGNQNLAAVGKRN